MDRSLPEASVLIPCYNGRNYIGKCLETVALTRGLSFEIIVVDNGSSDGSLELIRSQPRAKLLVNRRNMGFALAINQAASLAKGQFLAILNQDTEVDPDWLLELTSVLKQDPTVAVCGPKIAEAGNRNVTQQLGVTVDKFGFGTYILNERREVDEVFMVSGAAMAIRRDVFDMVGRLDPEYFLFGEDLDLCWRVRLAGFKVMVNSRAVVLHHGGSSMKGGFPKRGSFVTTQARRYYSERNTLQTLLKNYQGWNLVKLIPLYLAMNLAEMAVFLFLHEMDGTSAYVGSLYYNLTNFKRTWRKHLEVARIRHVPDETLSTLQDRHNLKVLAFTRWGVPRFTKRPGTRSQA